METQPPLCLPVGHNPQEASSNNNNNNKKKISANTNPLSVFLFDFSLLAELALVYLLMDGSSTSDQCPNLRLCDTVSVYLLLHTTRLKALILHRLGQMETNYFFHFWLTIKKI